MGGHADLDVDPIDGAPALAFAFGHAHPSGTDLNALLGGKGRSLAVMTAELGMPVPPGFTFTTAACRLFMETGWSARHERTLREELRRLEAMTGLGFGSPGRALLLSVRSGGAVSMPGMMDTVLNVGLCRGSDGALIQFADDKSFAEDCRARLEQTFAKLIGRELLTEVALEQLRCAVEAVFRSWSGERAKAFRRIEGLDDSLGTAVTVQAMVFGNLDDYSGTGVVFSRDPSTGEPLIYGDVLFRAQGEDVVSGAEATLDVARLAERDPDLARQLGDIVARLERHNRDLVEIEFTIESGKLWILQYRTGKRSPLAAVRIAHDMALDDGFPLTRTEAVKRAGALAESLRVTHRAFDPGPALARGLAASPGLASGALVVDSEAAVAAREAGRAVILARSETSPSDVEGIAAAVGILTARGGLASHAAVVARGWGKVAVVGCKELQLGADFIDLGGRRIAVGEDLTLDGATGEVFAGRVPVVETTAPEAAAILRWSREGDEASFSGGGPTIDLSDEALVNLVSIKGFCSDTFLAELLGPSSDVAGRLIRLSAVIDASKPRFLKVTPAGAAAAAARLDHLRAGLGKGVAELLEAFAPLNATLKQQVTEWQSRIVDGQRGANDHRDMAYDQGVLDEVGRNHQRTRAWLAGIGGAPDVAIYAARLDRAIARVADGDHAWLVSPRLDSYHNVWFELHEYLLRLAGRSRQEEEA